MAKEAAAKSQTKHIDGMILPSSSQKHSLESVGVEKQVTENPILSSLSIALHSCSANVCTKRHHFAVVLAMTSVNIVCKLARAAVVTSYDSVQC